MAMKRSTAGNADGGAMKAECRLEMPMAARSRREQGNNTPQLHWIVMVGCFLIDTIFWNLTVLVSFAI